MEVVKTALKYGFWVFGGYVRDVIVRGDTTYNDIDIGCSWDQMNLVSNLIEDLGEIKILEDTLERTGRTRHNLFPYIRRIINIETPECKIDIIVFSSFHDYLNQPFDISCNLFYLLCNGVYIRGQKDYTELTKQKKFIVFKISEDRVEKLIKNGWSEVLGGVG